MENEGLHVTPNPNSSRRKGNPCSISTSSSSASRAGSYNSSNQKSFVLFNRNRCEKSENESVLIPNLC